MDQSTLYFVLHTFYKSIFSTRLKCLFPRSGAFSHLTLEMHDHYAKISSSILSRFSFCVVFKFAEEFLISYQNPSLGSE